MTEEIREARQEASFKTPFFEGKIRGESVNLIITFGTFVLLSLIGLWIWTHRDDMTNSRKDLHRILEAQATVQGKTVSAIKENTCLLSLPQEKREQEFASPNSFCKRMSQ